DIEDPEAAWARADTLFEHTALTDLRWSALTRWRAALAHLFDLSYVQRGAGSVRSLTIEASDTFAARLFAGWLKSHLRWASATGIEIRAVKHHRRDAATPLHRIELAGEAFTISLEVPAGRACLEASVTSPVAGAEPTTRIVPLG